MNLKLSQPDMLAEARKHGGWGLAVETLVFIIVFIILMDLAGVILLVGIFVTVAFENAGHGIGGAFMPDSFFPVSQIAQIISIFATLLLAKWFYHRRPWTLGFKKRNWLREYAVGMGAGFLMMTLVILLGHISGCLALQFNHEILTAENGILLLVTFLCCQLQGMGVEVLCRGLCIISMARKKGNLWAAVILSSMLFAAAHLVYLGEGLLFFCNLTLFGIFAGLYFLKRGDIWGIAALHSLWNFTQGNIWGVPISGIEYGPSIFISVPKTGSFLTGGGEFRPESSFFATLVLIIGILILLRLPQKDVAPLVPETAAK